MQTVLLRVGLLGAVCVVLTAGCRSAHCVRTADYAELQCSLCQPASAVVAVPPVAGAEQSPLAGPHSVEDYILRALDQNPAIQAARSRVIAMAHRVPQAASLRDPMLSAGGAPFYPYVIQTAGGRMTADIQVSQEVPWFGKLAYRAAAVEAEADAARAQLAAEELRTIQAVRRAYYELHFVERALEITEHSRRRLADVLASATARLTAGTTSQQDVLRLQAELAAVDSDLIERKQQLASTRAELAALLHESPEVPFASLPSLAPLDPPRDIELLYQRAVSARPELHAALAGITRDRHQVELAHLNYWPDFTFQAGWGEMTSRRALAPTADGLDNVSIGMSLNLPLYRKRLDAAVREAEAQAVSAARQYDRLRDDTIRDVKDLFARAGSQYEMSALFRDAILPKLHSALDVSIEEYKVGRSEFAQMIDNWRELLRLEVMHIRLETQLRQSLAELDRIVGGYELAVPQGPEPVPADEAVPLPATPVM